MPSNFALSVHFFLQLAVVLAACRLTGLLLVRLGQTQVVADMVAGFLLGPSLLGLFMPGVQQWLFPTTIDVDGGGHAAAVSHPSLAILYTVGQLGLVYYMFCVGIGLNVKLLSRHVKQSAVTSLAGVFTPLVFGGALGYVFLQAGGIFPAGVTALEAALFIGAAIAITAFPMLARIINESGISHTRVGTLALACAGVDDAAAWMLLALVVALSSGSSTVALVAIGGTIAYLIVMLFFARPLLRRMPSWGMRSGRLRPEAIVVVLVLVLMSSWATDTIGVYSVFGAFMIGTVMPRTEFTEKIRRKIEPITNAALLPVFFIYSGLNTELSLLLDLKILGLFVLVVLVAVVSKGGACFVAARLAGLDARESMSLAALMNARGLMELILLNIGLQAGIVGKELYTVLALMTIVTTLAASPLYGWVQRRYPVDVEDQSDPHPVQ